MCVGCVEENTLRIPVLCRGTRRRPIDSRAMLTNGLLHVWTVEVSPHRAEAQVGDLRIGAPGGKAAVYRNKRAPQRVGRREYRHQRQTPKTRLTELEGR